MSTRALRRTVVADAIGKIHQRSRGVYGKRRIRAALLEEHQMIVNIKLIESIMRERGLVGLPRPRRRRPDLLGVSTPARPGADRGCRAEELL
nr:transposase [Allorhizocola rhizosphaerae]